MLYFDALVNKYHIHLAKGWLGSPELVNMLSDLRQGTLFYVGTYCFRSLTHFKYGRRTQPEVKAILKENIVS